MVAQRVVGGDLAVQSPNGTPAASDRTAIDAEADVLVAQIGDITSRTDFNGTVLIDAAKTISIQTGVESGETVDIALVAMTAAGLGVGAVDLSTAAVWRPNANQNMVARLSAATLLAGRGFRDLFASINQTRTYVSVLANVTLSY